MEKDKVSKGGFNFSFTYTNEKTYNDYVKECFKNVNVEDLLEKNSVNVSKETIE
ncbi:hypothetical protein P4V41_08070 [Fictibacillus nanhaiensis]|uniref:hypothetical protein n=1 Tax=Fictibacillus nanhaiensis TaxID=742169 RepID=UPI002E1EF80B|nr:hypothetical protein [Fictibacillus nanhaiensis]